ncbi:hypothetical protein [Aeromicrobium sp. IC_218]|uniref:CG0192-related protein n=1 Tax=Aeromicrobium sp. IC_218 TaxID=2545468 RepID=UPI00103D63FC|nr:hypothetical protein [Aeromicrobium sp. IC_218]TCI96318.1 hypothetical protein E0W78_15110 [Aeromicrobium sp. IC_218]
MALIHDATLSPGKLELLAGWLPGRPWWRGDASALTKVATFRFDDPDGEVGMETFLLRGGDGPLVQVPLTYRAAPLEGAEAALVGTMEHSVLGPRWVYDACADPVHMRVLATTIAGAGREADQELATSDGTRPLPGSASVRGDGAPGLEVPGVVRPEPEDSDDATTVRLGDHVLRVQRRPGTSVDVTGAALRLRQDEGDGLVLATLT